jgi:myo-inositol-1(or 4)-monophosphatase
MEPMVVMAARAAQTVGQELLKAHQNRHKLDLQVEEKGIDGPVTRVDRYFEQLQLIRFVKVIKTIASLVKSLVCKKVKVTMQIGAG